MLISFKKLPRRLLSLTRQLTYTVTFIVCERILPIKSGVWCFCTWDNYPHTIDNPRAVFEVVKNDSSIVKIIIQKRTEKTPSCTGKNVVYVSGSSIKGAYYLAISQVVLLGYSLGGLTSYSKFMTTKHIIVQLWHGIPLKKIGKLFPGETMWDEETHKYAATVCSSTQDKDIMAAAFAPLQINRVWLTGLPRNDFILCSDDELPLDYQKHLKDLQKRISGRKFILYAPTWRKDGKNLYVFSQAELIELSNLLIAHNAILGIRGHANVRNHQFSKKQDLPAGIMYVNDIPDVNIILRETEILITDYSSIYIDFLLTKRPILYFTYDVVSYLEERGFLYELEEAFTDQYFTTFSMLLDKLSNILKNSIINEETYQRTLRLFHTHDFHSGRQVAEEILSLCTSHGKRY
jgi:CDP-glycerol glycerophosphotransferase (TagB/SpsB family)